MASSGCGHVWEGHFEHGVEDGAGDACAVPEQVGVGSEFGDQHVQDYLVRPGNSEMALMAAFWKGHMCLQITRIVL